MHHVGKRLSGHQAPDPRSEGDVGVSARDGGLGQEEVAPTVYDDALAGVKLVASEVRKLTVWAMSSGVPIRPTGTEVWYSARLASSVPRR